MSETFTKLFSSITDSTIWSQDNETRLVWITMLAMADQNGYVGASVDGLARRANVPIDATERALAAFLSPDTRSRSQDKEGRRIEVSERGWTLINYRRFRELRDEDVRKEGNRLNKRAQRNRAKLSRTSQQSHQGQPPSAPVSPSRSDQKQIEIRSDQNGAEGVASPPAAPVTAQALIAIFCEGWAGVYPGEKYVVTPKDAKPVKDLLASNPQLVALWAAMVGRYLGSTKEFYCAQRHPLWAMAQNPNEFMGATKESKKSAAGDRTADNVDTTGKWLRNGR